MTTLDAQEVMTVDISHMHFVDDFQLFLSSYRRYFRTAYQGVPKSCTQFRTR